MIWLKKPNGLFSIGTIVFCFISLLIIWRGLVWSDVKWFGLHATPQPIYPSSAHKDHDISVSAQSHNQISTDRSSSTFSTTSSTLSSTTSAAESSTKSTFETSHTNEPTEVLANSTLGFQQIFVISSEDTTDPASWRQKGLIAAANRTDVLLDIVPTRDLTQLEISNAHTRTRGQAKAWAAHQRILNRIISEQISTALIMEDDVDWDVDIKKLLAPAGPIAKAVRQLTDSDRLLDFLTWPYGKNFDIFWFGHCGARLQGSQPNVTFPDENVLPVSDLSVWDRGPFIAAPDGQRSVRVKGGILCTFAYAVTASGAATLLEWLKRGGDAFDVEMNNACESSLRCLTVQPELMHQQRLVGGKDSLIAEANGLVSHESSSGGSARPITFNIRHSARCNAGHSAVDLVQCLPTSGDRHEFNGR